ncbi:glutamate synthase subunit beta [Verminephrobacter eiseniae]|uniref:Glutamate synthase (NADH) small subunit n=1 Tax=Verminephrobacter eiseniae (strain EF01-2) TaxID=391735 RepID=A1WKI5_VEREI|nr:glutamate synthase subunit beta [Verminephrobacter eiseniae]ABM58142.1 glutamate synthase (NADH) small subunit [Verminephrobacter eiseniae EF01-2]MCW5263189.1 glutamate synthase subunit beta [Verminephrobacter eiseniae]MCW5283746.1 glutamate synthase subunit beta [Verminephrobacter eiseniae]MCW5301456.1 glutamate synthase subunit beta [Verminephrobacter eiseniae]MCW8178406.1 glutamate synthase subunit beta [Verminephrobacter eiseniae]
MGKTTGFMEHGRIEEGHQSVAERLRHYKEFVIGLDEDQARVQGARCMDCGTPFCSHGCPVNNIIPDFNDLIYQADWKGALEVLHSTNNFPEFTGRICPAPCEAACVLNVNDKAVGIKSIEHAIIDRAWQQGWVQPRPARHPSGKKVAVVGSGPAGMAAAQQLARAGHGVTLFEKNDRVGGLLRYGIPDFKMEKSHIDRRIAQLQAEGVVLRPGVFVGSASEGLGKGSKVGNAAKETVTPEQLYAQFDAVLLTGGAEQSRDLPVPGRGLDGIHFAMEFLPQQNKVNAGDKLKGQLRADGKHVIVIGGGDTGSDCVGTSRRHGAASVTQFELLPRPPEEENRPLTWPYWPIKLRTSSSHEEGCAREFAIATREFVGDKGRVTGLKTVRVQFKDGKLVEIAGSEQTLPADLVLLAMGFVGPVAPVLDAFGVEQDARGNARASTEPDGGYATNVPKVFAAGDMRRGQSLVVWAIREGRQAAHAVDRFLMGHSELPR